MKTSNVALLLTLAVLLLGLAASLSRGGTTQDVQSLGNTLILSSAIVLAGLIIAAAINANRNLRD